MDTVDKADQVTSEQAPKKRGRPAKQADVATPQGEYRKREAQEQKSRKENNKIVEKWYEMCGQKISLCKKTVKGTVYRTFVGSLNDKKTGEQLKAFVEKQKAEGNLKVRI